MTVTTLTLTAAGATSALCPHQPPCPQLASRGSSSAVPVFTDPHTGWRLLCNGLLETGLPDDLPPRPPNAYSGWFLAHAQAFRLSLTHYETCAACQTDAVCPTGEAIVARLEGLQDQGGLADGEAFVPAAAEAAA